MSRAAWRRLAGSVPQSLDAPRARVGVECVGFRASYWTGPARLLDGRLHATRWKREIADAVARRGEALGVPPPGLAAGVEVDARRGRRSEGLGSVPERSERSETESDSDADARSLTSASELCLGSPSSATSG